MLYSVPWSLVGLGCLEKDEIVVRAGDFSQGMPASMAGTTLCRSYEAHKDKYLHSQMERGRVPALQSM